MEFDNNKIIDIDCDRQIKRLENQLNSLRLKARSISLRPLLKQLSKSLKQKVFALFMDTKSLSFQQSLSFFNTIFHFQIGYH